MSLVLSDLRAVVLIVFAEHRAVIIVFSQLTAAVVFGSKPVTNVLV